MKILMCNKFHFIHGGAERYLFDLCRGLKDVGHEVFHFSTQDDRNFDSECRKFFVGKPDYHKEMRGDLLSKIRTGKDFIYSFEAKDQVGRLIDEHRPQVAHIHNIYHQISPSILDVLKKRRIPVVMTLHDYKIICPNYKLYAHGKMCEACNGRKYYQCFLKKCIKNSWHASFLGMTEAYTHAFLRSYDVVDRFIAPSRFVFEKVLEFGVPRGRLMCLPYAIDLSGFSEGGRAGKYVVYSGRLLAEKGLLTLLESLKYLPGLQLKIVGDGPFRSELAGFVSSLGLTPRVELLDHRSRAELSVILCDAICVVVPSQWPEPAGLVIYEAFASGKCVIASDAGGISGLIEDGVNGLLFEAGKADELAHKIRYVVEHPEKARAWGKNGSLMIRQGNDLKAHVMRMQGIYHDVLNLRSKDHA